VGEWWGWGGCGGFTLKLVISFEGSEWLGQQREREVEGESLLCCCLALLCICLPCCAKP
jgi:hypothetical protein